MNLFKPSQKVLRTRKGFQIISTSIWVGSLVLSLPEIIYSKVEHSESNTTICHMTFPIEMNETGYVTQ